MSDRKRTGADSTDVTRTTTSHPPDQFNENEHEITSVAAVVDVKAQERTAGPVPAEVVSDRRDTFPRRLSKIGLCVLVAVLLGWIINGQVDTHRQLHRAERDRSVLIDDVTRLARIMERQGIDLHALRRAIIKQNQLLRANGLPTIPVPPLTSEGGGASRGGGSSSTPRSQPPSSAPPSSSPTPRPTPSDRPTPSHSPPIVICLPIVHCVAPGALRSMTVLDWEAILARAYVEAY